MVHPQVLAHYAPSAGCFPLPWWARIGVPYAYAALLLWFAARRLPPPSPTQATDPGVLAGGQPVGAR
ncbi:hypothetical protein ACFVFI_37580 [Streptomyces sp. NPDC057705]|uniref:hypothetical protein n=1 Tax=Streptomyces sp. NPDC057705 TaxID=3346222 RepID=UPI0036BDC896